MRLLKNYFYALKDQQVQIEAELELGRRLISGSIGHVTLFLVVLIFTPYWNDHPWLVSILGTLLISANILRFFLAKWQIKAYPTQRISWLIRFDILLIVSATVWGILCEEALRYYSFSSTTSAVLLLVISGITAGAATSLNTDRLRAHLFISLTLGIPFVFLVSKFDIAMGFTIIFAIYYTFLSQQIRDQSTIYWNLLKSREMINGQKQVIEASLKAKSEFLANMGHELRTPMNGVLGITDILLHSTIDPEQSHYLKIIKNCGETMLNQVNDILDFSKIESHNIELEKIPFPIHQLVNEVLQLLQIEAIDKGISLTYQPGPDVPLWIIGDANRFRQIIINLVGNALKFTQAGSIEISSNSKILENKQRKIRFSIKDTGIGIPKNSIRKLFKSFSQVDASTTRKYGGTGLGLAICKGLCSQMGGSIWVKSTLGVGSTFYFTFIDQASIVTVSNSGVLPLRPGPNPSDQHPPLLILIAEDNHTNQIVTLGLLKKLGHQADIANNGLEVLEKLEQKSYDIIFMDCQMPEMDGFETTSKIINNYPNEKIPWIIALTASAYPEDREKCLESGMNDFITKPISPEALLQALKQVKPKSHHSHFDFNLMRRHFYNEQDIMSSIIADFLKTYASSIIEIKHAIEEDSPHLVRLRVHKLRGTVSNFFVKHIQDKLLDLEAMGKNNDLTKALSLLNEITAQLEELRHDLESINIQKGA